MISIIIEIRCDACESTAFACVSGTPDAGEILGRVVEATPGWSYTPDAGRRKDYCPGCTRKRAKSPLSPWPRVSKDA